MAAALPNATPRPKCRDNLRPDAVRDRERKLVLACRVVGIGIAVSIRGHDLDA